MNAIDHSKFGGFVAELRREKNLTQKELAERLFVSDKAVSKWERGLSLPAVDLLMPLADALGVTVTELLKGERLLTGQQMDIAEVESLVTRSVQLTVEEQAQVKEKKRRRAMPYALCLLAACAECVLFWCLGWMTFGMKIGVWTVEVLMFFFGAYFAFLASERLPSYYDEHKVSAVLDGFFRMNMPGMRFNNSNWPHIVEAGWRWCLAVGVLYPLAGVLLGLLFGPEEWIISGLVFTMAACFSIFIPIYRAGKKYE